MPTTEGRRGVGQQSLSDYTGRKIVMLPGEDGKKYPAVELPGGVYKFISPNGGDPFAKKGSLLANDEAKYGAIVSRKVQGGLTTVVYRDGGDGKPLTRQYTGAPGDRGVTVGAARPGRSAQAAPKPGRSDSAYWGLDGKMHPMKTTSLDASSWPPPQPTVRGRRTQTIWDPYQERYRAYDPSSADDRQLMLQGSIDRGIRESHEEPETLQHMVLTALGDRFHENKEAFLDDVKGLGTMGGWAADHQRRVNLENRLALTPPWAMSPAERAKIQAEIDRQKAIDAQRGAAVKKGLEYSPMGKVIRSGVMAAKGNTAGARTLLSQVPEDVWVSAGHDPAMAVLSVAGGLTGAGGTLLKAGAMAGKLKGTIEVIDAAVNANKISAATGAAMKSALSKTIAAAPAMQRTGKELVHYGTGGPLKGVVVSEAKKLAGAVAPVLNTAGNAVAPVLNTAPGKAVVAGVQQAGDAIKSRLPKRKPLAFDHLASKAVKDSVEQEGALVSGPAAKEVYVMRRDRVPKHKVLRAIAATSEKDMSERIPIPEEFNSMFEPMPITGLFGAMKRVFGVHVAPPGEYNFNTRTFTPNVKRDIHGNILDMTPEEIFASHQHKWTQKYAHDALLNTAVGLGATTYLRNRLNNNGSR
jgi:hypothetical protein